MCSHLCVCICVLLFAHIYVDFRVPLADALGQIGSMLDRFCCFFGLTIPAFSHARAELLQKLRKKLRKELAENLQRTSKQLTRNAKNMQRTRKKCMQRTFPKTQSQRANSIHRRDGNRNKPQAIKEGAAVLALAHSNVF